MRHFKILLLGIFFVCSQSSEELTEPTTTITKPKEIVITTTTVPEINTKDQTTIELLGIPEYEEVSLNQLEVGDCYIDLRVDVDPNYYYEKVHKTSCSEPHNSEIIYKAPFIDQFQDTLILEVEAGLRCNRARSLYDIVEWVDPKYATTFFLVESVFDSVAVTLGEQNSIICSAYLEPVEEDTSISISNSDLENSYFYDKYFYDWSIYKDDINRYVYGTFWDGEFDSGIVCQSSYYQVDPFFTEFMLYYSIPNAEIEEIIFIYENSEREIRINFLDFLVFFSDSGIWEEDIFYYFLPISQIISYQLIYNFDPSFDPDFLLNEPAQNVKGTFILKTLKGERVTSTCSMDD